MLSLFRGFVTDTFAELAPRKHTLQSTSADIVFLRDVMYARTLAVLLKRLLYVLLSQHLSAHQISLLIVYLI